jgi:hypothetical protein
MEIHSILINFFYELPGRVELLNKTYFDVGGTFDKGATTALKLIQVHMK